MNNSGQHIPVMTQEVIQYLDIKPGAWYIDATFGRGGHTQAILNQGGKVIAFDVDQEAIDYGEQHFATEIQAKSLYLIRANFEDLSQHIHQLQQANQIDQIAGILFDFGTSTNQLMSESRGFSFNSTAPLDMRMDQRLGVTANDLLNVLSERQLMDLFQTEGGESEARRVAHEIKYRQAQLQGQLHLTAKDLADLVSKTKRHRIGKLHPATKVFQALRIAVNSELDSIAAVLPQLPDLLMPGGRIVTIAFHEGEDRLVKKTFNRWELAQKGQKILKHSLAPTAAEQEQNPRSRSAQLRAYSI